MFWPAWQVEYGNPRAQFLAQDVAKLGSPYVHSKITVKGTVKRVDLHDPKGPMVYLNDGVRCNFGRLERMAESCTVGQEVLLDGYLRHCHQDDVLLNPTVLTSRPFMPKH